MFAFPNFCDSLMDQRRSGRPGFVPTLSGLVWGGLAMRPSENAERHFYFGIVRGPVALRMRHLLPAHDAVIRIAPARWPGSLGSVEPSTCEAGPDGYGSAFANSQAGSPSRTTGRAPLHVAPLLGPFLRLLSVCSTIKRSIRRLTRLPESAGR